MSQRERDERSAPSPRRPVRVEPRPLPPRELAGRRARRRRRDSGVWTADLIVPLALGLTAFGAHFALPEVF